MKKVLFLMLFLLVLGAANVSAQVRIGGDEAPNAAAVLDLNVDGTTTGTKGLALPRVSLSSDDAKLDGVTDNLDGMLVYNTGGTLSAGVYFWDGSLWVAIGGDGIVVNAVTDATAGGGLVRAGSGTAIDPHTLGIAPQGVDTSMLKLPSDEHVIMVSGIDKWHYAKWTLLGQITGATLKSPSFSQSTTMDATNCVTAPTCNTRASSAAPPCVAVCEVRGSTLIVGATANWTGNAYAYCWKLLE